MFSVIVYIREDEAVDYGVGGVGNQTTHFNAGTIEGQLDQYHYENEDLPHHITGIIDRTGVRFVTWTYDEQGRGNSSEYAGGVEWLDIELHDIQAVDEGQVVQTRTTNSLGHTSTFTWQQASRL